MGGCLVPISTLTELFAGRIEISSQHQSQALLRPEIQSRVLDEFGGLRERCARLRSGVSALRAQAEGESILNFTIGQIGDRAGNPQGISLQNGRVNVTPGWKVFLPLIVRND